MKTQDPDWQQITREWLREQRGRRSQRVSSRRLGYGSNIVYRWETGRCWPSASAAFRAVKLYGRDPEDAVSAFLRRGASRAVPADSVTQPEGVCRFLAEIRGDITLLQMAERTRFNRFTLSRWFRGVTEPRFPELLELIEATTHRALDFLAAFGDPQKLPSVRERWRAHLTLRNAAFDAPWSHAVLRALELQDYARLPRHEVGWIAARLGISPNEERRCLELLEESGQIEFRDERWVLAPQGTIDTGQDPARARELRRFWLQQALGRFDSSKGAFGYNLFTISEADYAALKVLYAQFFEAMRDLIANTGEGDRLVLFCGQLLEMTGGPDVHD